MVTQCRVVEVYYLIGRLCEIDPAALFFALSLSSYLLGWLNLDVVFWVVYFLSNA